VAKFRRGDERQQATEKHRPNKSVHTIEQNRQTYMSKRGVYICIERDRERERTYMYIERERVKERERQKK
jgi:hypothetical protein